MCFWMIKTVFEVFYLLIMIQSQSCLLLLLIQSVAKIIITKFIIVIIPPASVASGYKISLYYDNCQPLLIVLIIKSRDYRLGSLINDQFNEIPSFSVMRCLIVGF